MSQHFPNPYAFDYRAQDDGRFAFTCSQDPEHFAWLALPPHHPAVIQTQSFWCSIGAVIELEGLEEGKWTALTWTDWDVGSELPGHAVRGLYERVEAGGGPAFSVELFDEHDHRIATIRGRGVVFRNRNFEEWREGSKSEARKAADTSGFTFAGREALGLSNVEFPFVAPLQPGTDQIEALVTSANGLPPANPFLSGSGDHVNSTHFAEVARQTLCLVTGDPDIAVRHGEMTLKRYVELGTPFRLKIARQTDSQLDLVVEQLDRECSEITLSW